MTLFHNPTGHRAVAMEYRVRTWPLGVLEKSDTLDLHCVITFTEPTNRESAYQPLVLTALWKDGALPTTAAANPYKKALLSISIPTSSQR